MVLYQQGVGTRRLERLRGGAVGLGLSRNVRDCYRFLVENYEPVDYLYLFGFSRGAFTARSTAGLVRNAGMLRAEHLGRVDTAYRLYRAREDTKRPSGSEAQRFRSAYSHPESEIRWSRLGRRRLARNPHRSSLPSVSDPAMELSRHDAEPPCAVRPPRARDRRAPAAVQADAVATAARGVQADAGPGVVRRRAQRRRRGAIPIPLSRTSRSCG